MLYTSIFYWTANWLTYVIGRLDCDHKGSQGGLDALEGIAVHFNILLMTSLSVRPMASSKRKVLIIGVDGLRYDRIAQSNAPTLQYLFNTGRVYHLYWPLNAPAKTLSAPGWSTLMCGVWPNKHNVVENNFFPNRYKEFPDILTRIVRAGLIVHASLSWPPLGVVDDQMGGPLFSDEVSKNNFDGEKHYTYNKASLQLDFAQQVTLFCIELTQRQARSIQFAPRRLPTEYDRRHHQMLHLLILASLILLVMDSVLFRLNIRGADLKRCFRRAFQRLFLNVTASIHRAIEIADKCVADLLEAVKSRPSDEEWLVRHTLVQKAVLHPVLPMAGFYLIDFNGYRSWAFRSRGTWWDCTLLSF